MGDLSPPHPTGQKLSQSVYSRDPAVWTVVLSYETRMSNMSRGLNITSNTELKPH